MECEVAASEESPLMNPALVIKNWGQAGVSVKVNGKQIKRGKGLRCGYNHTFEGSDLVVWLEMQSAEPITISLSPAVN
jgi:hypothetical protein